MVKEFLKLAWRNIWRNKRRSYITMTSVAFAVLLSSMMMSVQYGTLDHMINNVLKFYTGHIQIHDVNYWEDKAIDNSLTYDQNYLTSLESIQTIALVEPRIESFALSAFMTRTKGSMVLGIDPDKDSCIIDIRSKLINGNYFHSNDKSVIISSGLANYLGISVGDSLVLMSQGFHGESAVGLYPVVGLVKFPNPDQNNSTVCMPLKEAQWFYGLENKVSSIAILTNSQDDVNVTEKAIAGLSSGRQLVPMSWEEMMPELVQTVNMKISNGKIMIMVLYIVIGFGMFGTFLMMTAERTYEFGVIVAVGMKRFWIQITVFLEILMMSFLGVMAGVVMSISVITYFHYNPVQLGTKMKDMYESYGFEPVIEFSMQSDIFIWQAWAIFIIGFVLSFYPIFVLKRIRPVEAMRNI